MAVFVLSNCPTVESMLIGNQNKTKLNVTAKAASSCQLTAVDESLRSSQFMPALCVPDNNEVLCDDVVLENGRLL